jgi:type IV secretion system protein TrbL
VKILVLAVIVGIGSTLFSQFTQGFGSNQPTIEDALSIMLGALSLFGLGIFGPSIATGLVSGAPQLGAGAAVGTAFTAGGLGAAAALGAGAAIGAAGSGLGAAARGASRLSGSSVGPATAAASNSASPSSAPAWAQRLQRGARHAGRAAVHVVRSESHGGGNSVSLDQEDRR